MAIPDGWVLVPREPTEAMLAAPEYAKWSWRDDEQVSPYDIREGYKAMLAAAPSPPEDAPGGG